MFDVCIVGAGPAGATAARLLGRRYRVLLVDPRPLDRPHEHGDPTKPCGGLLAPRAQAELARQGLGVPPEAIAGPQLFAVRTVDLRSGLERLYQRFYVNADREVFDRWLVSLVPPTVERAFGWRAVGLDQDGGGALVRLETPNGGRAGVTARLVVGADGAASMIRRAVAPRDALNRYVAVQGRYVASRAEPYFGAVFDTVHTDFYGWTIPKGDTLMVGAAFLAGPGIPARFDSFVSRLRSAGFCIGCELGQESAPIARPSRLSHIALGGGAVALVGEAAGLISPSSAEGISFALQSGARLAQACIPGLEGAVERYRSQASGMVVDVAGKLLKSGIIYTPAYRTLALRSGLGSLSMREDAPPSSAANAFGV